MPVDYSKWDNLELSDDSDIEVHPNVDKRSFIRAKQNQIHLERQQRRHQIETLKYERQVNDGLARRIASLLAALRAHADEARASSDAAGQVAFRAVMESAGQLKPEDDRPPAPPADVHANVEQPQSYTKMMAALLDQVNKALDERPELDKSNSALGAARYDAMVEEIEGHQRKVADLQAQLVAKLGELEHDEARKITSEGIHTGFDSSFVNKAQPEEKKTSSSGSSSSTAKNSAGKPELLNPNYDQAAAAEVASSSASQSKTSPDDDYDVDPSDLSDLGRKFASFAPSNHFDSRGLLMAHPEIMTERNEEAILVMAFEAALEGHDDAARQYVHQAKLLEYCRSLGRDGVTMFFKRIETRNHKAQELFYSDVQETYGKIHARVREIRAQQTASTSGVEGGVEQIQLHAVEPGTVINIHIPPPVPELKRLAMETMDSYETAATYRSKTIAGAIASGKSEAEATAEAPTVPDFDPQEFDEAKRCREIFESFSPEMRKALESGSLDKVNEVLGRMPVDEAETLVGQFGDIGILSLEDEIIDATTEEGRAALKEKGREDFVDENGIVNEPSNSTEKKEEYGDPE